MTDFRVCPSCGSGKVDRVIKLVGQDINAACANCGWSGKYGDLIYTATKVGCVAPGVNLLDDMVEALGIAQEVSLTYMRLLAKDVGRPIGKAMLQSGVVGAKDTKSMARLIKAACRGAHKATLDEIEKMQEELQNARRPNAN
jgi:hypothetical protein